MYVSLPVISCSGNNRYCCLTLNDFTLLYPRDFVFIVWLAGFYFWPSDLLLMDWPRDLCITKLSFICWNVLYYELRLVIGPAFERAITIGRLEIVNYLTCLLVRTGFLPAHFCSWAERWQLTVHSCCLGCCVGDDSCYYARSPRTCPGWPHLWSPPPHLWLEAGVTHWCIHVMYLR